MADPKTEPEPVEPGPVEPEPAESKAPESMEEVEARLASVLAAWPSEIDISEDGVPAADAEGHHFLALSLAWQSVEEGFGCEPGSTEALMVWAVYRVLHAEAMEAARRGDDEIRPASIPTDRFRDSLRRVVREARQL